MYCRPCGVYKIHTTIYKANPLTRLLSRCYRKSAAQAIAITTSLVYVPRPRLLSPEPPPVSIRSFGLALMGLGFCNTKHIHTYLHTNIHTCREGGRQRQRQRERERESERWEEQGSHGARCRLNV